MNGMKFDKIKNNMKKMVFLALTAAFLCSSCAQEEASKEESFQEQSGVFSEITTSQASEGDSESGTVSETVNVSTGTGNDDDSENPDYSDCSDYSEDMSEDSSEGVDSSDSSEQSSNETSEVVSEFETSSEDSSEDISENGFENSSENSSADDSSEDIFVFDIPEEYKDLDSYKALEKYSESVSDVVCVEMNAETKYMNQDVSISIKSWESSKKGAFLSEVTYKSSGKVVSTQKELIVGNVKYIIDDSKKTYCIVPDSEYTDVDELLKMGTIEKVETRNELVGIKIYVADWFILSNGSSFGMYTKDGELKYICIVKKSFGMTCEMLFEVKISEENSKIDFSIPNGYSRIAYAS